MGSTSRRARVLILTTALAVAATGGCGSDPAPGDAGGVLGARSSAVKPRLYYLGQTYAGMALTERSADGWFFYGECGESADECAPDIQVENASICRRNPLEIDAAPRRVTRVRGALVVDYGGRVEILAGRTDAVVHSGGSKSPRAAIGSLRSYDGKVKAGDRLPATRLPRWVMRELQLIRTMRARGTTLAAMRSRLGISRSAIRDRLALTRAIGSQAFRRVKPATVMPKRVIEERHALLTVEEIGERNATRAQRRMAAAHRARRRAC